MEENNKAAQVEIKELPKEDELTLLRKQVEELKREKQEKELASSLDSKIEEIVGRRLTEREESERRRIEDARRMIEEADKNAALEQELLQNERYNQISSWRENKLKEFQIEIDKLAQMGHMNEHPANMYKYYDEYVQRAAHGDGRAVNMLGKIKLIHAAMNLGGERLTKIFKRNIGIIE